jgi:hypothetical protein
MVVAGIAIAKVLNVASGNVLLAEALNATRYAPSLHIYESSKLVHHAADCVYPGRRDVTMAPSIGSNHKPAIATTRSIGEMPTRRVAAGPRPASVQRLWVQLLLVLQWPIQMGSRARAQSAFQMRRDAARRCGARNPIHWFSSYCVRACDKSTSPAWFLVGCVICRCVRSGSTGVR